MHGLRVSLTLFILCWWRHDWLLSALQLWYKHVKVISNSLDIDFIHGNIHGRSCSEYLFTDINFTNQKIGSINWFMKINFLNTCRHEQNGLHFADDIFNVVSCIFYIIYFLCVLIQISVKFLHRGAIDNMSTLIQTCDCSALSTLSNKSLRDPM